MFAKSALRIYYVYHKPSGQIARFYSNNTYRSVWTNLSALKCMLSKRFGYEYSKKEQYVDLLDKDGVAKGPGVLSKRSDLEIKSELLIS